MAGLGFKDFTVGEVLTSSDVDGYLMQQTVMRFADSAARGSALGTAVGTAVALAEGMVSYLDDTNSVQVYAGTGWKNVAGILQVVSAEADAPFVTTSTSTFETITGASLTITPSSVTSKVLLFYSTSISYNRVDTNRTAQVAPFRGGSNLIVPASPGSRNPSVTNWNQDGLYQDGNRMVAVSGHLLDSPASTSSLTYDLRVNSVNSGGVLYVNRSVTDTDSASFTRSVTTITAMEVAA